MCTHLPIDCPELNLCDLHIFCTIDSSDFNFHVMRIPGYFRHTDTYKSIRFGMPTSPGALAVTICKIFQFDFRDSHVNLILSRTLRAEENACEMK